MFSPRARCALATHVCCGRWGVAPSQCSVPAVGTAVFLPRGGSRATSNSGWSPSLVEQRRYSFKYATKTQMDEMRQPAYIHDKRYGLFSDAHNVGKARRGLPSITPLYTKHMNLWETDTDAGSNRFFQSYVFGQRELHQLLGRPHAFEADGAAGRQGDSAYELQTDQRYKGIQRPALANLHFEPEWNYTLYRHGAHGSQLTNPRSPLTAEVLGPELLAIRDIKSTEHCRAWFDRLQYLIKLHFDAVGDIGEFKSRHTQHVHEFFVMFHDALSSFDFQDAYLLDQFAKARPKELEDVFGIFLQMESNYINQDYCPRCSLPYATTRYCGEGDTDTPFRKHRGRWAPHQQWGKEWLDVVVRRAEALWYRSTEDPYFGTAEHTQQQVEGLLGVYVKAKQRAKAVDFMHAIRGSKEFLFGRVAITDAMQHDVDHLLDTTPHQHLLTNAFSIQSGAALYTGETNKVPHSPLQLRVDLERQKYRRQQKEEGVVRVPPASWRLDTSAIVPYKLQDGRVTNWREVKEGIERSFLSTGLPKDAYTSEEWREMLYWQTHMARRGPQRAAWEQDRLAEEARAVQAGRPFLIFPDKDWYRVFDTSADALKAFGLSGGSGMVFTAAKRCYPNPAAVPFTDAVSAAQMTLDTTDHACKVYGDLQSGDVVRLVARPKPSASEAASAAAPSAAAAASLEAVVVGVNKAGAESEWSLVAMYRDTKLHAARGLVELGRDCVGIAEKYEAVERLGTKALVTVLAGSRTVDEEFLGQVVGVRDGQLYVQWRLLRGGGSDSLDRSVAVCLGPKSVFAEMYKCRELSAEPLVEPAAWRTPFRNDFAEERLRELQVAPFQREQWASLVKGKYTPKPKKFGYTQHTTQDDFETKEYKDRVLARQFFHDPQAFQILPERREKSVKFGGKWEYQRTHGLPTVDRNELENGWGESEPVTDDETNVIEQALRDISGRRPGNFVKSPTETQNLQLNEPWWAPMQFGWEERNREQRAFLDSTEQSLVSSAKLPFQGKIPPFGTSYGIGERVREIAADYAKGFGLGPHGHAPGHDTTHHNTLGAEDARVQTLGLSNPVVRLFDEKLGDTDPAAWALQQCGTRDSADVKQLLLSLHEWRERGRAPSLLLSTVLARYLEKEVEQFNEGLPPNVPRLSITAENPYGIGRGGGSGGVTAAAAAAARAPNGRDGASQESAPPVASSSSNVWADTDSTRYAYAYAAQRQQRSSNEAFIVGLVQRAVLGNSTTSFSDIFYTNFLQQDVVSSFQLEVARHAGRGIPSALITQRSFDAAKGNPRNAGTVLQYIRLSELAKLLRRMNVSAENISTVERGLANCPEHIRINEDTTPEIAVPVALVLSWGGPGTVTADSRGRGRGAGGSSRASSTSRNSDVMRATANASMEGRGRGSTSDDMVVAQVLDDLATRQDGLATDVLYAIRENKRNPVLRQEFFNAFLPVFGNDHAMVAKHYDDYCAGRFVPPLATAFEVFSRFLANITEKPQAVRAAVPYFSTSAEGSQANEATARYTQLELLPPTLGPFLYDNVKVEAIETVNRFRRFGIVAGPATVVPVRFLPDKRAQFGYSTGRLGDTVAITADRAAELHNALQRLPQWKVISANPALEHVTRRPVVLVATFNRFFQRVAPMLTLFYALLEDYAAALPSWEFSARNANRGLERVLERANAPSIEQEFRRNAERYWRNVLDGRRADEAALIAPLSGQPRSSSASFGSTQSGAPAARARSAQSAPSRARGGAQGSSALGRAIGATSRDAPRDSLREGPRSSDSNTRGSAAASRSSSRASLDGLLGKVGKDTKGAKAPVQPQGSNGRGGATKK